MNNMLRDTKSNIYSERFAPEIEVGHGDFPDMQNCMSYALGFKEWAQFTESEDTYTNLKEMTRILVKYFKLSVIKSIKDVSKGDKYVFFRYSSNLGEWSSDFHFVVRDKRGKYKHKLGRGAIEAFKDNIAEPWVTHRTYGSDLLIFKVEE